eukprot:CAMPEP_0185277282 /NCGR_PEP_ID=MMETSP1359-20130426/58249_1 /TAXON_ID=552665 /ORGANISM="Bigelowiella longifila, Strain CCMP242" /LENGTH=150 /DNA_ID=CAMNT_0027871337 /DNA_START=83 /DNA_END=535 /DNA_ORIENTATION=+
MVNPTRARAETHYEEHKDKPFFPRPCRFLTGGPVVAMVWEGLDVIPVSRKMIGSTSPADATPGTIRGDFAAHFRRNIVHGSDSKEAAAKEIDLWFSAEETIDWEANASNWIYELPNAPCQFNSSDGKTTHHGHMNGMPGVEHEELPFHRS